MWNRRNRKPCFRGPWSFVQVVIPEAGLVVVALVGEGLCLGDPIHEVGVNRNGCSVDPARGNVVGEDTVAVVEAGEHLVALGFRLLSNAVEFIPSRELILNLVRIVCSENILRNGTAIGVKARSCLPGNTLQSTVFARYDIFRVLVHLRKVIVGQADVFLDVERVFTVDVFQSIVSFDEEDVDLAVGCGGVLCLQGSVKFVLVVVVLGRVNRPLYGGAVFQSRGGFVFCNACNFRIVRVEATLKFIVPAPDVKNFAFGRSLRRDVRQNWEPPMRPEQERHWMLRCPVCSRTWTLQ